MAKRNSLDSILAKLKKTLGSLPTKDRGEILALLSALLAEYRRSENSAGPGDSWIGKSADGWIGKSARALRPAHASAGPGDPWI